MNEQSMTLQQHAAEIGAATSTATVAAYHFTDFLTDASLVVAVLSGSLAIAWHVYRFWREYKDRKDQ